MPKLRRVTLTDVARRAGVSVTTASYILNGRSAQMRISKDTDIKVREAMRELQYQPNWSARTLRRKSTQTIGLVSDFIAGGAFSSELLTGANAAARQRDHLLVIGESQGDPELEQLLVEELLSRQVDGIVYATRTAREVEVPDRLREVRTVLLNCVDAQGDLPAVVPDDVQAGRTAAEILIAAGRDGTIQVVGEDPTPSATAGPQRMTGIHQAMHAAGRVLGPTVACEWDVVPAREAMLGWLATHEAPAGLICLNDRVALGTYQALQQHGYAVPHDVSVVSFDGSEAAAWLQPEVTSLRLPLLEMGERAIDLVLGGGRVKDMLRLPLTVHQGGSVA